MTKFVKEVRSEKNLSDPVYKNIAPGVKLVMMKDTDGDLVAQRWVFESSREISSLQAVERWFKANMGSDPIAYAKTIEKDVATFDGQKQHSKTASVLSDTGGTLDSVMVPTDDQMDKILPFLRSAKTPNQLAVFPVLACNTLVDRDDDQFTRRAIDGFVKLPEKLSFVGKSFLWDHDHKAKSALGRIFDVEQYEFNEMDPVTGQEQQFGVKEWVYVPRIPETEHYLNNLDYGILWAVSVGVGVTDMRCSIDNTPMTMDFCYGAECDKGHLKGYYYAPDDEDAETPSSKKMKKDWVYSWVKFNEAIEGMETSQVWLGAQYGAQVPVMQKAVKGLQSPHGNFTNIGMPDWAVVREVIRVSAPQLHHPYQQDKQQDDQQDKQAKPDVPSPVPPDTVDKGHNDPEPKKAADDDHDVPAYPVLDSRVLLQFGEGGEMDLRTFYEALRKHGFPELVGGSEEEAFTTVGALTEALSKTFNHHLDLWQARELELQEKSELGDEWLEETRDEIRRSYRIARASDPTSDVAIERVDMTNINTLLTNIGPNSKALRGLMEDWKAASEAKLPRPVRRSSVPDIDFLEGRNGAQLEPFRGDPAVTKIHG